MTPTLHTVVRNVWNPLARKWLLAPVAALAVAGPSVARADRYDRDGRPDRDDHRQTNIDLNIRIGERRPAPPVFEERRVRVWVPAEYRTVTDRHWVEPVYRTVVDRKWIEPVYRTECERVWVADVFETREVRHRDRRGDYTRIERVLVAPAHFENRERRVCVSEGRWDKCERRELVCDGRWETVERQEVVCAGHYEERTERVRVADRGLSPVEVVNPMLRGLGLGR